MRVTASLKRRGVLLGVLAVAIGAAVGVWALTREEPRTVGTGETARRASAAFPVAPTDRVPDRFADTPGTPWGDYVGSHACRECHAEEYAKWRDSFHSRTLYGVREEVLFTAFTGTTTFEDRRYAFTGRPHAERDAATGRTRYFIDVRLRKKGALATADTYGGGLPDAPEGDWEVLYAWGNRRHQVYLGRAPDGKHWVLPVMWNDVAKEWRYDGFRPYVESCANCHVTGIRRLEKPHARGQTPLPWTQPLLYDVPPAEEGWAEGSVGCEVCHGPGRGHVEALARDGADAYAAGRKAGTTEPTIYSGRASQEAMTLQCDQCHDFFTESTVSWIPTPHGYPRPPRKEPITRESRGLMDFYEDGSPRSPCTMGTVFRRSRMFREGIKCTDCHDPHGTPDWADLRAPTTKNELCLTCHEKQFPDEAATVRHSRHAAGSPGNRCVECHMPRQMNFSDGVEVMSSFIHKHDFGIPTGVRRAGGPTPACNLCHEDRDDAWTRAVLEAWRTGRAVPK